ncbi:GNAT family N-acetyltransferase [Streptococcus dysgalactiae subsp. equisimilis]|uniref:GNAT family N-acetyltransferase n=1 Tax=Streptococcus dysgalactiae TaxID=1334 RepID=UPI00030B9827|nr:GNAT family N-acetyltransferase [Streptococcus dysgalactiae]VTS96153.1 acetyltransferase [Streptococcus dysgalactiae subsp. equisimilis]VTY25550.1 Acetyltransferase (GNAT) family protein [Streptococcus dysgalactiae]
MKIIEYKGNYRDDLIFMVLEAKNALGKIPSINPDLLTIETSYLEKEDCFWLAVNDENRVIGSIAYSSIPKTNEVFLHCLFIKPSLKHQGIGSQLLAFAEDYLRKIGKSHVRIHLGQPKEQWFESYQFYPKHGYQFYDDTHLIKKLI